MSNATIEYKLYEAAESASKVWRKLDTPPLHLGIVVDSRARLRVKPRDLPIELERFLAKALVGETLWIETPEGTIFEIKILQSEPLNLDEQFSNLLALKTRGNELLKSGRLPEALAQYSAVLDQLEFYDRRTERDVSELIVPVHLNRALIFLKQQEWARAIEAATLALELDPSNVKAFFRRAVARIENRDFGMAKRDLLSAQFVEPKNAEVEAKLQELKKLESMSIFTKKDGGPSNVFCDMDIAIDGVAIGSLRFRLFGKAVERTVKNFEIIVKSGKYAGCKFFKIVRGQFAQSGDYEYNDGSGGNCHLGNPDRIIGERKFFNDENLDFIHTKQGLLGMANYGPNSNQSQFYITLGESLPHLDGKHVVFGELIDGQNVLEQISEAGSQPQDGCFPTRAVVLDHISIVK